MMRNHSGILRVRWAFGRRELKIQGRHRDSTVQGAGEPPVLNALHPTTSSRRCTPMTTVTIIMPRVAVLRLQVARRTWKSV